MDKDALVKKMQDRATELFADRYNINDKYAGNAISKFAHMLSRGNGSKFERERLLAMAKHDLSLHAMSGTDAGLRYVISVLS